MKFNPLTVWRNIQELDLRPIRALAEREVHLAFVGQPGVGKRTLASQLRADPRGDAPGHSPGQLPQRSMTPILLADLDMAEQAARADLIVLLVDVNAQDLAREQALVDGWRREGAPPLLIFYNKLDTLPEQDAIIPWLEAGQTPKIYGSALDARFLQTDFTHALMKLLPDAHLALGRRFPLLREPIAREMIHQTCLANLTYSFGTGLAEIVPVLDVPLNIADIVVLTKSQAMLVYKLGLALGLPKDWQYYLAEFSSVIGGGFVWRQIARSLVGLIPVWGIIPKTAVAYSGTYVVGHAVLAWYLTGRHLPREQLKDLSRQAFQQGAAFARNLLQKLPRPKRSLLPWQKTKTLPLSAAAPAAPRTCPACHTRNDPDAVYCKYCGHQLAQPSSSP